MSNQIGLLPLMIIGLLVVAMPVAASGCTCSARMVAGPVRATSERSPQANVQPRRETRPRSNGKALVRAAGHNASLLPTSNRNRVRITSPIGEVRLNFSPPVPGP
jgi:hypothetical protein